MMTGFLRRIGFVVVLLAIALFSFAQRPATGRAAGSTDNVQLIDLAKMALPLSAYGPDYAAFGIDQTSSFDPQTVPDPRHVASYNLAFTNPAEGADVTYLDSAVALFVDGAGAASFFADGLAGWQSAVEGSGGSFSTFPVMGFEQATGFTARYSGPNSSRALQYTYVWFISGRLGGQTAIVHWGDSNMQDAVIAAAKALNDRMNGVLTGSITDFPAPLLPDVNCNGRVDAIDAALILQLNSGLVASLPCGALADANRDGVINAIDAALILQYSAGLIHGLPTTS